jgi:hypothetical protein
VGYEVRISVASRDLPSRVDANGRGALETPRFIGIGNCRELAVGSAQEAGNPSGSGLNASAKEESGRRAFLIDGNHQGDEHVRRSKRGDGAVCSAQEVSVPVGTRECSCDCACRIDGSGCVLKKRGREIDGDGAVGRAHEADRHGLERVECNHVVSRDLPCRVDAHRLCTSRAGGIKGGELTILGAHEAVTRCCVTIKSCDHTARVDGFSCGALERENACARSIEGGDGSVDSAQKPVVYVVRISIEPSDRTSLVDGDRLGGYRVRGVKRGVGRGGQLKRDRQRN